MFMGINMNKKRMLFIPMLLGTLLCGCTIVKKSQLKQNTEGTFVIRMDNENTSLKLDVHSSFDSLTDFIEDTNISTLSGAYCYSWFNESINYKFSDIHNEYTEPEMDRTEKGIPFYKFTFFIKNTGDSESNYYMDIALKGIEKNHVDESIRVLAFEGDNKQTVYAKASKTNSNSNGKELIQCDNESLGLAEIISENEITIGPRTLGADKDIKYTLLFWIEGTDPECEVLPDDVTFNVEVNIKAYK